MRSCWFSNRPCTSGSANAVAAVRGPPVPRTRAAAIISLLGRTIVRTPASVGRGCCRPPGPVPPGRVGHGPDKAPGLSREFVAWAGIRSRFVPGRPSRDRPLQSGGCAASPGAASSPPAMDETPHILVVDDHREIRELLARYLAKSGFRVSAAENAAAARRRLQAEAIDLVGLDVMMPGEDGLSLCRALRATGSVPVILPPGPGRGTDRTVGLEIGADDSLTKPFTPRELLARIRAVLLRVTSLPPQRGRSAARGRRLCRWGRGPADGRRGGCASPAGSWTRDGASSRARTASRCRSAPASTCCWWRCSSD